MFCDFLHPTLQLADVRLPRVYLGGAGDEDEPALVSKLTQRLGAHERLAHSLLAYEQSRARPAVTTEDRFDSLDDLRTPTDCHQRRKLRSLPCVAERAEECELGALLPPLRELRHRFSGQHSFELGDDRRDIVLVRWADKTVEVGGSRGFARLKSAFDEGGDDAQKPTRRPVVVGPREDADKERRLAVSLDRGQQHDELAGVGLLEPAVGPFDPVRRNVGSERDGSMRNCRDHVGGRPPQPGDGLERHPGICEELARTPEVRIFDEVIRRGVRRLQSIGNRARRCSHRRLDIVDTSLCALFGVPSPSRHLRYKLLRWPQHDEAAIARRSSVSAVSPFASELRQCLGVVLGSAPPEPSYEPLTFFRQWLAERNLGLVPIANAADFDWPGYWVARVRASDGDHAVLMFGSPSGPVDDPAGALASGGTVAEGWLVARLDVRLPIEEPYGQDRRTGSVVAILRAADAESPLEYVETVDAVAGRGLVGDRYYERRGTFSGPS